MSKFRNALLMFVIVAASLTVFPVSASAESCVGTEGTAGACYTTGSTSVGDCVYVNENECEPVYVDVPTVQVTRIWVTDPCEALAEHISC